MIKIAESRIQGIDWVQEQLEYLPRPIAEQTYFAMVRRGILVETDTDISLTKKMGKDDVRKVGLTAENDRENHTRRQTNFNSQRQRRNDMRIKHHNTMKQLNSIDCVDDEGTESK